MRVKNITVDGEPVKQSYALENSLLTLRLNEELQPKESIAIGMDFEIVVAQTLGSHYSVQTYYENVLTLAHAYPMIAVYDDEGWNAEIPPQHGDMTYADMSFYVVTVEAPTRLTLVASGREISREESANRQRVIYAAGPARDFYLAASSDYAVVTKETNNVALRFYARKSEEPGAKYALEVAARALEIFNARYGQYPYRELDFVSTPTTAGGVEYPGMIAIARQYITPNNGYLEAIAAHETGHQWFYNLVGNDQLDEPWLDESLTQFATLQYFTETGGADGFHQDLEYRWASVNNKAIPLGLPVSEYNQGEYGGIIYGRGALFFEALRAEMGAEIFDAFMLDYAQTYAWGVATTEKLKEKAEEHCACDLTPLFQEWVYP
jgi:aminopeptidase N